MYKTRGWAIVQTEEEFFHDGLPIRPIQFKQGAQRILTCSRACLLKEIETAMLARWNPDEDQNCWRCDRCNFPLDMEGIEPTKIEIGNRYFISCSRSCLLASIELIPELRTGYPL
jgi:MinD superfamily P-loop ATPase